MSGLRWWVLPMWTVVVTLTIAAAALWPVPSSP